MSKEEKILYTLSQTDFTNYNSNSLEQFINDNIKNINYYSDAYNHKNLKKYFETTNRNKDNICFTSTEIIVFLKQKFNSFIESDQNKKTIVEHLHNSGIISNKNLNKKETNEKILEIANTVGLLSTSITNFFNAYILNKYLITLNTSDIYFKEILQTVEGINKYQSEILTENEKKYIKNDLKKSLRDFLYLTFSNGFSKNIVISNSGVTSANEGDATQFLFISRAMLAGFNCSNVDLRSSRYDAVIDINGKILRVQVKGISNNEISFRDRDRGGGGIDTQHQKNIGKLISSKEIDLYVAVQKNTGICYIIPAIKIDKIIERMTKKGKKTYKESTSKLQKYKEKWDIIYEVANYK